MKRDDLRKDIEISRDQIGKVQESELKEMAGAGTSKVEPYGIFHSITFCFTLEIGNHSCYPNSKKC